MKRFGCFLSGLLLAVSVQAQYFQLTRDGVPNPQLRFGSESDCKAAAPKIGLPGVYACPWNQTVPASPAKQTAPAAAAPSATAPASGATPPSMGTSAQILTPACSALFAASPLSALSASKAVDTIGTGAKPARGAAFKEPAYGTCVTRAADRAADGLPGFAKNDYSRRQAFNADNTRQLVFAQDGFWHLYDANTHAHLAKLNGPAGDAEPQWHPTDPTKLAYLPTTGIGMKLLELDVAKNTSTTVADFSARLKAKWPDAMAAWTRSEGSPSADGRYWCFMVDGNDWKSRGVFTWDRQTDTILGTFNTNGERPDHVSMSPSGSYCVVSSDGALGTVAFSRDFSKKTQLLKNSEHSDLALDASGKDVYVAIDYGSNGGDVIMVDLATGTRTSLFSTYLEGTATAMHFSGKAFAKPGWLLVSTYADGGDSGGTASRKWLHRKLLAVQLQANPKIYSLAFTRDFYQGYDSAPVATASRDFSRVAFNSNWGKDGQVEVYTVELPPALLK